MDIVSSYLYPLIFNSSIDLSSQVNIWINMNIILKR